MSRSSQKGYSGAFRSRYAINIFIFQIKFIKIHRVKTALLGLDELYSEIHTKKCISNIKTTFYSVDLKASGIYVVVFVF